MHVIRTFANACAALLLLSACDAQSSTKSVDATAAQSSPVRSGYAQSGPLKVYYEVHGSGEPVLLIPGALSTIDTSFGTILPELAKSRQVIAMESQGHGHTPDIDRPLTMAQMGDDAAAVLKHLKIDRADVVGYSDGGDVAVSLAIRHPERVRKLVVLDGNYDKEGLRPEIRQAIDLGRTVTPETVPPEFGGSLKQEYAKVAPDPARWPVLVTKVLRHAVASKPWTPEELHGITGPTMLIFADHGQSTLQHMVKMHSMHRNASLAVIPGRDHINLVEETDTLRPILLEFLNEPAVTPKIPVADKEL